MGRQTLKDSAIGSDNYFAGASCDNVFLGLHHRLRTEFLDFLSCAGSFCRRAYFAQSWSSYGVSRCVCMGYFGHTTGEGFSADWILFWNSIVRLGFFLILNEFIDHLRRSHLKLQELSRKDSLTGIPNSRVFEEQGSILIENGGVFSLAYIDLDGFKSVNDEFGHSEGDVVLKTVASIIHQNIRKTDNLARLGGDEFGILIPVADADDAKTLIEKISSAIISEIGTRWHIGATFGVVTFAKAPSSWDFAVHQADILMYSGKSAEGT